MTKRTRLSVLLISTPILAFIVLGNVMGRASDGDATFQHLRVFEDVVSLILNNYVEDPKVDSVMEGAMRGLADSLDRGHEQRVAEVDCQLKNGGVVLALKARADADLEQWAAEGAADVFRQVYQTPLTVLRVRNTAS